MLSWTSIEAQYFIGGTNSTTVNGTGFYFINGGAVSSTSWSVTPSGNALIMPQGNSQASITFSAPGTYAVRAVVNGSFTTSDYQVVVSNPPPANPGNPTVTSVSCGTATLQRSGTPPSGVRWYWQGTNSNGFSTSLGFGSTYNASATGTYYIRARNTSTGAWSIGSGSVSVTINSSTPIPNATANTSTVCSGNSTFLTASGVSGATYRWYNASNVFIGSGATIGTGNLTSATTFRVSATVNGCESAKRNITVSVSSNPTTYTVSNNGPSQLCSGDNSGSVRLSDSQSGVNYQLFRNNVANGSVRAGNGAALTWNNLISGTYKIEATNANSTCATVAMSGQVTIGTTTPTNVGISSSEGTTGICPGTQVTLVSQGLSNQDWSTGQQNTTTITVTPPAGTTTQYTVSGLDSCGDPDTATISLTVNANIAQPNVQNNSPICSGSGTTLTASGISGATYRWYTSGNTFLTSGASYATGNLTTNTTYRVSATVNGCEGPRRSVTVSVTAPPQVEALSSVGASQVCVGNTDGSVRLADSETGIDYQLLRNGSTLGDPMDGTGNPLTWNGLGPGTYTVQASYPSGICGVVAMQNSVTINTASSGSVSIGDNVSDPTAVCAGEQVQLFATGVNIASGSAYTWSNSANSTTTTGTTNNVTLSAGSSITYTVSATDLCGDTVTESITLTAQQNMGNVSIAGPLTRCEGPGSYDYDASIDNQGQLGTIDYSWSISPAGAAQSFNTETGEVVWNAGFSGDAFISVNADNGCEDKNQTITVSVSSQITFYEDRDRDGYYTNTVSDCSNPDPVVYVSFAETVGPNDCDDNDATINPGTVWYLDADGDDHAEPGSAVQSCTAPSNDHTMNNIPDDDCDDSDALVNGPLPWYLDRDDDGFPLDGSQTLSCTNPWLGTGDEAFAKTGPSFAVDCDDSDPAINTITWYEDLDGDGLGENNRNAQRSCTQPTTGGPWVTVGGDPCPDDVNNFCSNFPCTDTFENETLIGENYIYSRTYQAPLSAPPTLFEANNDLIQEISYFDGLGRPIQQIGIDQSPNMNDIVTHMAYDGLGRMEKEWLPVPTTDGALATLRPNPEATIESYYLTPKYENTANPYSQKEFENSPLNRVYKQAAPGNDWALGQGHEIEFGFESNATSDGVYRFEVTTTRQLSDNVITYVSDLVADGSYAEGELFKNVTYDENHGTGKNHSMEEFTDKQGRIVLKRTYADTEGQTEVAHDTYYVYDDFGNLSFVLPPKIDVSDGVSQIELDELGYQYTYDHRNRMVIKKLPGKGEEFVVYNRLDQPIANQDANQRLTNEWLFTKYDAFGRVAITGKMERNLSRTQVQEEVNASGLTPWVTQTTGGANIGQGGAVFYYDDQAYPGGSINVTEILTINYYDAYEDRPSGAPTSVILLDSSPTANNTTELKGLATVSRVRVLDVSPAQWINTVTYYDHKAQPIYTYSDNQYLGTVDVVETALDFVGRPLKVKSTHTRNGETIVTIDNFTYDHIGRLLSHTQCIGDGSLGNSCPSGGSAPTAPIIADETVTSDRIATESITIRPVTTISGTVTLQVDPNASGGGSGSDAELIVFNSYDELGQLQAKKVGGSPESTYASTTGLQEVDYQYNVRGWLTDINNVDELNPSGSLADLFAFRIRYNDPQNFGGNENPDALFNGNISQTFWNTASTNNTANPVSSRYSYRYDAMNRITAAFDNTNNYTLSLVEFDRNGNITRLARRGAVNNDATSFNSMDNLTYSYDAGNKLLQVDEINTKFFGFTSSYSGTGDQYDYDANGNLTMDLNRNINTNGVVYNHLNLPVSISNGGETLTYIYSANGVKLRKSLDDGNTESSTDYADNFVYYNDELQFLNHPEGYVSPKSGENLNLGFDYFYQYKDHLGNQRLTYIENSGTLEIIEDKNYYPFGLEHRGYKSTGTSSLGNSFAQDYKTFQGQELTKELQLEIIEFKYRLHDPAIGRFWQVDPLAEDYVYNGTYNFAENRVVDGLEIEGLETFAIHGTWHGPSFMTSTNREQVAKVFGNEKTYALDWTGDNSHKARVEAASIIAEKIVGNYDPKEGSVTIIGHSHGGNVGILALNEVREKLGDDVVINLVTLNTPSRSDYRVDPGLNVNHFNIFSPTDLVQVAGGFDTEEANYDPYGVGTGRGFAGRKFDSAINISYDDQLPNEGVLGQRMDHLGNEPENVNEWLPKLQKVVNQVNAFQRKLRQLRNRQMSREEHKRNFEDQKKKAFGFN